MTTHPDAGLIVGWALTPTEVVADLRRILAGIQKIRRVCGNHATRACLSRNADTLTHAIRLIEEAHA